MFCTNCGAKLPEGSKFCMECGTKLAIAVEEPTPFNNSWNEPIETVTEKKPAENARPMVSFDWSNVKEESHKKEIPEVHSPWGTTGLSEKELFAEVTQSDDHSRTMSFIDILKKERDARAQAAEEEARPVTEREEPEADYLAFEEAPSFYVPPLYDDLDSKTETPFDAEELAFEEPVVEEEPVFEEPVAVEAPVEEEMYHTTSFDGPDMSATEDYTDLEASLAAILDAGAGKVAVEEHIDLFDDVKQDEESIEDLYLTVEDEAPEVEAPEVEPPAEEIVEVEEAPVFEEPVVDFAPKHGGFDFNEELEIESEEDLDGEAIEELENLYISEDDFTFEPEVEEEYVEPITVEEAVFEEPEPVVEPIAEPIAEPAAEPETVEDEIEALKRRLAELMGEPATEPEHAVEPEAEVESIFEEPEPVVEAEPIFEEPATEEKLEEEFTVEFGEYDEEEEEAISIEEAVAEIEESEDEVQPEGWDGVAEETVVEPESDALSLEDLEKDLFGDVEPQDVEPEATKKIDKFYTLYKKNEEFQRLLDEEYSKLQGEEKVPHVEDYVPVEVAKAEPVAEAEEVKEPVVDETIEVAPIPAAPVVKKAEPAPVAEEEAAPTKAELKAAKKAEKEAVKLAKKEAKMAAATVDDDEEEVGGGALTVIAVIIAALLVILLAVILILNFAPDSAVAMKIDSVIETITSMFSATDGFNGKFLL